MTGWPEPAAPTTRPPPSDDWRAWLTARFPSYVRAGFAPRHVALWEWFTAIEARVRPAPKVEIWPRGGAKSTSVELGCAWLQQRRARRFVLYVSGTQAQADGHVQSVGTLLERLGVERALNKYGAAKGWRQQELRTADGFNVRAFGLDAGARGVKIDDARPDVIIFDDVDDRHDTPLTVQKKVETITQTILPAGSDDVAVLFVQNRIHAGSVASALADDTATFLLDRLPVVEEPAVRGLTTTTEQRDGRTVYRVTGGAPTWEGQGLAVVEQQINTWGWDAFIREAQHEVARGAGQYFRWWSPAVHVIDVPRPLPADWPVWCALDYGLGHPLAFGLLARNPATDAIVLLGEHVASGLLLPAHVDAMNSLLATWGIRRGQIGGTFAGHDCWAGRDTGATVETIADRFGRLGWPLTRATIDRINGWSAISDRLGQPPELPPRLFIDRACVQTIACLPRLAKDPKRPDDVLKMNGDDPGDMLRYGVMAVGGLAGGGWTAADLSALSSKRAV